MILKRLFYGLAAVVIVYFVMNFSKDAFLNARKGDLRENVDKTSFLSDNNLKNSDDAQIEEQKQKKTLNAKAGVVIMADTGKIIFAENAFDVLPMASLTKIMSAMVALDQKIDLNRVVSISPDDYTIGGNLRIAPGTEKVSIKDLFYASITGSANNAALAIAQNTNLNTEQFTEQMNRKAVELDLESLHYAEASGLSTENVGSAYDVARVAGFAFKNYPLILDAASRAEYSIFTRNTQREHTIKNPDDLFKTSPGAFLASKTGYLDEALYCLILAKKTPKGMIIAVTLGNPSKQDSENETLRLLNEGEKNIANY
jgi:D-alanyl-D-alanine endopeptidase (penicillin-binding protein 7)